MVKNLPRMAHSERMARAAAKRQTLLEFLGSGEIYTTAPLVADLLQIDRSRAIACLKALEVAGALKSEVQYFNARAGRIYGITPHGIAIADTFDCPHFELGRTNANYVQHHLDAQRMHIAAVAAGWADWTPERMLRLQSLKKIPDAAVTNPAGARVAIEIERSAKTPKRYAEFIVLYLQEIKAGKYSEVHFVCPPTVATYVQNSFSKVESVKFNGEVVKLEAKHCARFKFFSFDNWPPKLAESEAAK